MKLINKLGLCLSLLTLAGCAGEEMTHDLTNPGEGKAVFNIATENSQIGVTTRADGEQVQPMISELKWLVSDTDGKIVPLYYGHADNQNTQLTLEGLPYGDYYLLCLATLNEGEGINFDDPLYFEDGWMVNDKNNDPVDGIYCYKKVPFSVNADGTAANVILEHITAMVSVDIEMPNISMWRHVKKVSVTFDTEIPTTFNAGGTYSGNHTVSGYDIYDPSGVFTFTTLPSAEPVSGYVEIESSRDNGDNFVQRYDFSDISLEAGKITHINLDYRHPELESGLLHVAVDEQWRYDIRTMLQADEPREVFYNNSERWFYTDEPLQVFLKDGKMAVRYYSPYSLKDVRVKACFNKISPEWVDLAVIEEVQPFMEAFFTLPVTERDCVFTGESGRKVKIPAISELTSNDVAFKFEWDPDDVFMNKIAQIKLHWYIRYCPFGADEGHAYWRHMDALLCRHAAACAYNMTYLFSSQEFMDELKKWDGKLIDDNQQPVNLDDLVARIYRHGGLNMGKVEGSFVVGLGGGETFGMADWCYTGFYADDTPNWPLTTARDTMFHEFGHCLGYGHNGNMTYGDAWTVLCSNVLVQLGLDLKLPVSKKTDVSNLPK